MKWRLPHLSLDFLDLLLRWHAVLLANSVIFLLQLNDGGPCNGEVFLHESVRGGQCLGLGLQVCHRRAEETKNLSFFLSLLIFFPSLLFLYADAPSPL